MEWKAEKVVLFHVDYSENEFYHMLIYWCIFIMLDYLSEKTLCAYVYMYLNCIDKLMTCLKHRSILKNIYADILHKIHV